MILLPNFLLLFHIMAFFLRTILEIIYSAQLVCVFYLQTVDEVMHASLVFMIWLLHPVWVFEYFRSQFIKRRDPQNTSEVNVIRNWAKVKVLQFIAGFNLIPIKTQATEAVIYDYLKAVDAKKSLDRLSSMRKDLLNVFTIERADRADLSEQQEPNQAGWFNVRFWGPSRKKSGVSRSGLKPVKESIDEANPTSRNESRDSGTTNTGANKLEEIEDLDNIIAPEKPTSKDKSASTTRSSVSEALGGPSFLEIKSMWGDRIRKKRAH